MNEPNNQESISARVLGLIREGKIRRYPRAYFLIRVAAILAVCALLVATVTFVVSFMLFSLHESGQQFLLGFGWHGIAVFLQLFPWGPALLSVFLIIVLGWLLRDFKFGYRFPILFAFVTLICICGALALVVEATPFHRSLLQKADDDQLPILGPAYEHIFDQHDDQGVHRGTVISVASSEFVIRHDDNDHDTDDGSFTVLVASSSMLVLPHVGDRVLVFGPQAQGVVQAQNIQILPTP